MTAYAYAATGDASPDAPLVFTFHGTGGTEQQFHGLASETLPAARVVSPRGDVSENGALRFFRRTGEGVYDMDDLARRTKAMGEFVAGFTAEPHGKAIGIGYSNGANILANMLFTRPDLLDAAILMHPLIPFDPPDSPDLAGRKVLMTAGKRDPICPPGLTTRLAHWLEGQGVDLTVWWHEGGHEVTTAEIATVSAFLGDAGA